MVKQAIQTHSRNTYYLQFLVLLSLIIYGIFAFCFPLLPHYADYPQLDIRDYFPSLTQGYIYGALLIMQFGIYGLLYQAFVAGTKSLPLRKLMIFIGGFALPLLFTYPVNATDIYRYFIRGRIFSAYGESQFQLPPSAFTGDPFLRFAGEWLHETTPYGPIWELVATAVTSISGNNLLAALLIFKLLALGFHLGITVLIWHALRHHAPEWRLGASWLWGANPALLLTFVTNGHNDVLMLFWLVLSIYLLRNNKLYWGLACAILAPLTKPIGLLALPFVGLLAWQKHPSWRGRLWITAVSILLTLGLTTLAFLPFGSPLALIERLGRELSGGASFSPFTLLLLIAQRQEIRLPFATLIQTGQIVFLAGALWLLWQTVNGRSPFKGITDIFGLYLLQALNFRIWYASWLLPWTLLDEKPESKQIKTAVYFLLTSQLSVLIYGHLREYRLDENDLKAHLIGVPFTFLLPFLLAKIKRRQ